jgi:V8-like Glu-specific endopeptidase
MMIKHLASKSIASVGSHLSIKLWLLGLTAFLSLSCVQFLEVRDKTINPANKSEKRISFPFPEQVGPISGRPLRDDRKTWAKSRPEVESWNLLKGDWISGCHDDGQRKYRESYQILDSAIVKFKMFYPKSSDCTYGELEGIVYFFLIEDDYKYEHPNLFKMKVTPESVKRYVFDSQLASLDREKKYCGISTWESTQASQRHGIELLGTNCAEDLSHHVPSRILTILNGDTLAVQVDQHASPPLRRDKRIQIVGGSKISIQTSILSKSTVAVVIAKDDTKVGRCTGTLVGERFVVTAAHCFTSGMSVELPSNILEKTTVIFGDDVDNGRVVRVAKIVVHPDFNPKALSEFPSFPKVPRNDLALLTLAETASEPYSPVAILPLDVELKKDEVVRLAGFGVDEESKSGDLKSTESKLHSYDQNSKMVILKSNTGQSTHSGDSGGPLFVERGGWLYLAGATSYGSYFLNVISGDGYYVDLRHYRDWLNQNAQ